MGAPPGLRGPEDFPATTGSASHGYVADHADHRWIEPTVLGPWPYADPRESAGRGYRGVRRAVRHGPAIVGLALLAVGVVVLAALVSAPAAHRGHPATAGGASASASTGLPETYEAEAPANTLLGSARTSVYPNASGGVIVQTLGTWGGTVGEGALRFNDVIAPASGTYALTFYYAQPNDEPTRTAVVTASGSGSVSVTVAGNATCCSAQRIRVELDAGANSVTFSNPSGHAPAIDKIVISAV